MQDINLLPASVQLLRDTYLAFDALATEISKWPQMHGTGLSRWLAEWLPSLLKYGTQYYPRQLSYLECKQCTKLFVSMAKVCVWFCKLDVVQS